MIDDPNTRFPIAAANPSAVRAGLPPRRLMQLLETGGLILAAGPAIVNAIFAAPRVRVGDLPLGRRRAGRRERST